MTAKKKVAPKKKKAAAPVKTLAVQVRGRNTSRSELAAPITQQTLQDFAISNGLAKYHLEQDDKRVRMSEVSVNGGTLFFIAEDASA